MFPDGYMVNRPIPYGGGGSIWGVPQTGHPFCTSFFDSILGPVLCLRICKSGSKNDPKKGVIFIPKSTVFHMVGVVFGIFGVFRPPFWTHFGVCLEPVLAQNLG